MKKLFSDTKNGLANSRIWSPGFILVLCVICTLNITMTMMMPILPIYTESMGYGSGISGLTVGIFTFAALLSRPLFGRLLDTLSRSFVLALGGIITAAACLSYLLSASAMGIVLLILIRILHGIGYSAGTSATGTLAADLLPPERRGEGLGYYGVVFSASLALGPAFSLRLFHSGGITAVFITLFTITAAGMVLALAFAGKFSCRKKAENPHPLPEEEKQKIKKQFVETSSLPASITMMFISFAYSAVMSFLAKYSIALGLGSMSIFFVYYAFSLLITRVIAGKYTDKHGMYNILPMGILVMTAVFVILGFSRNILLFLIAAVLYGLGYGSVQPTLNAIVMSVCAPHRRGAANTIFFGAMDIGIGLGATIWGIIADKTGYSFMYFFCIVVMAISLIYCFVVFRGKFGRNSLPNMDMQG